MALGQTVGAQQIVVRRKGWDPNQIDEGGANLSGPNRQPQPAERGTPTLGGFGEPRFPITEDVISDGTPFNHPKVRDKPLHTVNADPEPGM